MTREEMLDILRAQVPVPPELKGWVYRDMPGKVTPALWDQFLAIMGEGNYQIIIQSEGPGWKRGQFFISPEGMKNLEAYPKNKS